MPLKDLNADRVGAQYRPSRYGYAWMSCDPADATANSTTASGRYQLQRVPVNEPIRISSRVDLFVASAAVGLTVVSGGLWDLNGNLIVQGGMDAATVWQTANVIGGFTVPSPQVLTSDFYIAVGFVGTTMPGLGQVSNSATLASFPMVDGFPRSGQSPNNSVTATAPSALGTISANNKSLFYAFK